MTFHVKIEVECVNVDMEVIPATINITSKYYNPVNHYKPEISEKIDHLKFPARFGKCVGFRIIECTHTKREVYANVIPDNSVSPVVQGAGE